MTDDEVRGERALIWAMVESAIRDAMGVSRTFSSRQIAKRRAIQWLFSDLIEPFSFLWISAVLGISVSKIRNQVRPFIGAPLPMGPNFSRRTTLSNPLAIADMLANPDDNFQNMYYFE